MEKLSTGGSLSKVSNRHTLSTNMYLSGTMLTILEHTSYLLNLGVSVRPIATGVKSST